MLILLGVLCALPLCACAEETVTDEPLPRTYRELLYGVQDAEDEHFVYDLQVRLRELGYLYAEPNGIFDEATENAVLEFQILNGLLDTGIADMDMQILLFSNLNSVVTKPTPEPTALVNGANGADVRMVQDALARWGFLSGSVDGVYGTKTEKAVKEYKEYMYELEREYALAHPTPTPSPSPTPSPAPTPYIAPGEQPIVCDEIIPPTPSPSPDPDAYVADGSIDKELLSAFAQDGFQVFHGELAKGDKGREVRRLQTRLGHLGYLYNGADGSFGAVTTLALRYFQRLNQLVETGIADETTQRTLYADTAVRSTEYVFPYKVIVDVSDQRVYVYEWNGAGYKDCIHTFKCSSGTKSTPTPLGTYQAGGPCSGEWYYFKEFSCYAKYATRITGGILFHSVIYGSKSDSSLQRSSVRALGSRASHGCVRLSVEDAKWIHDNCPAGTTVVVQN